MANPLCDWMYDYRHTFLHGGYAVLLSKRADGIFQFLISMWSTNTKSSSILWFHKDQLSLLIWYWQSPFTAKVTRKIPSQLKGEKTKGGAQGKGRGKEHGVCSAQPPCRLSRFWSLPEPTPCRYSLISSPGTLVLPRFVINHVVFILIHSENIDQAAALGQAQGRYGSCPPEATSWREEHRGQQINKNTVQTCCF